MVEEWYLAPIIAAWVTLAQLCLTLIFISVKLSAIFEKMARGALFFFVATLALHCVQAISINGFAFADFKRFGETQTLQRKFVILK